MVPQNNSQSGALLKTAETLLRLVRPTGLTRIQPASSYPRLPLFNRHKFERAKCVVLDLTAFLSSSFFVCWSCNQDEMLVSTLSVPRTKTTDLSGSEAPISDWSSAPRLARHKQTYTHKTIYPTFPVVPPPVILPPELTANIGRHISADLRDKYLTQVPQLLFPCAFGASTLFVFGKNTFLYQFESNQSKSFLRFMSFFPDPITQKSTHRSAEKFICLVLSSNIHKTFEHCSGWDFMLTDKVEVRGTYTSWTIITTNPYYHYLYNHCFKNNFFCWQY